MPTIQVRNVPEPLHRQIKAQAAAEGMSLSDYVLAELRVFAGRPTMAAWLAEVSRLPRPDRQPPAAADVLRSERARSA